MNLTKNFTLEELCVTDTGGANIPNEMQKEKLLYVATFLLQPIWEFFGPIKVRSGFRSEWVNEKIGGSKTSQHVKGEACDLIPLNADINNVFNWCRKALRFGQLIDEHKNGAHWIHISLPRIGGINSQVMRFENGIYTNI